MTTASAPLVPVSQKTNTLAIASLVAGILQFNIVAVILGHVALGQIKRTGEGGRMLAIIGLVLGYLAIAWIVLVIVIISLAAATGNATVTYG